MDFVQDAAPDPERAATPPSKRAALDPARPLDAGTLAPLRGLITAKIVAMLILVAAAIGGGALLTPQVADGVGLAPHVSATVAAVVPLPASENVTGAGCVRERVALTWGDGGSGSYTTCAAEGSVSVGDTVAVRAVAGFDTVVVGGRTPNTVLALVLALVVVLGGYGAVRYLGERRDLVALAGRSLDGSGLVARKVGYAMAFDVLSVGKGSGKGKGKRATVQVRFDDAALRPLRMQIPGATEESMAWQTATVFPVTTTRRGRMAGPYVLGLPGGGRLVATGRAIRPVRGGAAA